ncbi:MAG: DNA recombination protein RmuC, partial [bacterium]|nr:DNA recombination protein RmuC [bacterium]
MEIALLIVVVVAVVALAVMVQRWRLAGIAGGADDSRTRAAQLEVQLTERDAQLSEARGERDAARNELKDVRGERDAVRNELAAVKADHQARTEELAEARKQIETQFKGIAADVAKANSATFLEQAKEQFENQRKLSDTDLEKRQKAIDELVKPVKENLDKFEKQVTEMEKDRKGAYDVLRNQVGQLRDTAQGLSEALRSPQMRGQWGEQQLRNILELSGLSERIDFVEQDTVELDEGRGRPDAVVHIPGGLEVVIDAKTPLSSYLEAHHSDDEQRQSELLNSHANTLLSHAKTLGDRDYASAVDGSPDFVVMFVPAEPILDAAMDVKPTLWEDAWQRHRVLIATPGLLLA